MSDAPRHELQKTALHAEHLRLGAKMTRFHGWEMPLYYTSILDEHACVRSAVGIFDISHMGQVWVSGRGALATLEEVAVSEIAKVDEGRACYTMLLNERGGILDDILVYHLTGHDYLVIINCANRASDTQWLMSHQHPETTIRNLSVGRSMIAVQGPRAAPLLDELLELRVSGLGRFDVAAVPSLGEQAWVSRTGYTGSDGFELFVQDAPAVSLWRRLLERGREVGLHPVGLGARDTLRLEAGLRLYGVDMDQTTTPYDADLGWTVAIHKPSFIGKPVLLEQKGRGVANRLVGFTVGHSPVPRHGCPILIDGRQVGRVTSGTFSAQLDGCIGMGYVEAGLAKAGTELAVMIRNKAYPGHIVKLPFWRGADSSKPAERIKSS